MSMAVCEPDQIARSSNRTLRLMKSFERARQEPHCICIENAPPGSCAE